MCRAMLCRGCVCRAWTDCCIVSTRYRMQMVDSVIQAVNALVGDRAQPNATTRCTAALVGICSYSNDNHRRCPANSGTSPASASAGSAAPPPPLGSMIRTLIFATGFTAAQTAALQATRMQVPPAGMMRIDYVSGNECVEIPPCMHVCVYAVFSSSVSRRRRRCFRSFGGFGRSIDRSMLHPRINTVCHWSCFCPPIDIAFSRTLGPGFGGGDHHRCFR